MARLSSIQTQIRFRSPLDRGEVFAKTLPNPKATFALPPDRVHSLDAMAIYADKNGDDYAQWSDVESDTGEFVVWEAGGNRKVAPRFLVGGVR